MLRKWKCASEDDKGDNNTSAKRKTNGNAASNYGHISKLVTMVMKT